MKTMKKKIAVAVTVALLAFPLSTTSAMANNVTAARTTMVAFEVTTDIVAAETAVKAYEDGSIDTLVDVATTEGLLAAAETAVGAVIDVTAKGEFEQRVTDQTTVIATAKTALQEAAAEEAVAAYEKAPLTTLVDVTAAEGLKAAADTKVAALAAGTVKSDFEQRVTAQTTAIATAKTAINEPIVDGNGHSVLPANWFTDLIAKLQDILTFNPVHKAELHERRALAKLAQAQELMKDGKTEEAKNSLNQYTDKIAKAQAFLAQVDTNSETAENLIAALDKVNSNNIVVLGSLIDRLPKQAAQKLAINVVRSMEKAVSKMQKEEVKADLKTMSVTTPTTTAAITPEVDREDLKHQAKVALENFKKSLNQKGKVHLEDQDQEHDQDQDQDNEDENVDEQSAQHDSQQVTQNQSTKMMVAPVRTESSPTFRTSEKDKADQNRQEDSKRDKGGDNRRGH